VSEGVAANTLESVRYSRVQLLIILLTPILVIVSSTLLYFGGYLLPDDQSNHGVLLSPVLSVTDLGLPEQEITPERQWRLIQVSPNCEDSCLAKIYEQRQMHIALGKLAARIDRVLLTGTPLADKTKADLPRLAVESFNLDNLSTNVTSRISEADLNDNITFVVDPFGNIMLYFTSAHDYRAQMSDLKKLLKLSTIG